MDSSPAPVDMASILEIFGYSGNDKAHEPMLADMRDIEQSARRMMRTHLRPREFAEVAALAEASAAAQAILANLRVDG